MSKRCPKNPAINGGHDLVQGKRFIICAHKCGFKKEGKLKPEAMPDISVKSLMLGRSEGTLKGGKWGNSSDKQMSSQMHRQNPEPRSQGEASAASAGCFFISFIVPFMVPVAIIRAIKAKRTK